jgi:hypothetical protein
MLPTVQYCHTQQCPACSAWQQRAAMQTQVLTPCSGFKAHDVRCLQAAWRRQSQQASCCCKRLKCSPVWQAVKNHRLTHSINIHAPTTSAAHHNHAPNANRKDSQATCAPKVVIYYLHQQLNRRRTALRIHKLESHARPATSFTNCHSCCPSASFPTKPEGATSTHCAAAAPPRFTPPPTAPLCTP